MPHVYRGIALQLIAITTVLAQNIGLGPGMPSATPAPQPTAGQTPETRLPVFLSGTVMFAGGAGPAGNIPIQRVCEGAARTVAFTNGKGQFSFQWGSSTGLFPDAGDSAPVNTRRGGDLSADTYRGGSALGMSVTLGCELIAVAPGYQPARVDLSGHRAGGGSDVGMMVLHRLAAVEGTSVSFTSLNAPKDARRAWEKGVRLLRSRHPSDVAAAEQELEKAVAVYPRYANAWADLGRARLQRQEIDQARDAFLKAIDADDKLVQPYIELGNMAAHRMQWTEAARYLDRALTLDPVDYPRLWLADGLADYHVNNFDRAERNAREALKLSAPNQDPAASRLLGYVLMQKEDYAGADQAFRAYLRLVPDADDRSDIKARLGQIDAHLQ
jgi:Flp pilus assembly protein TadD